MSLNPGLTPRGYIIALGLGGAESDVPSLTVGVQAGMPNEPIQ